MPGPGALPSSAKWRGVLLALALPLPWMIGPLVVTAVLTASGVELSAAPRPASSLGQLFIGVSLGSRSTPGFARAAPRRISPAGRVT